MLIEALAAAVVGLALLWLVLQPMVGSPAASAVDTDIIDPEETAHGQALLALKEIEFDRATGKLSDVDYASLNARYSAAAIAALEAPVVTAARCLVHGACAETDARFCPECGAGLVTEAGACLNCNTEAPAGAVFCPGCGTRLAP